MVLNIASDAGAEVPAVSASGKDCPLYLFHSANTDAEGSSELGACPKTLLQKLIVGSDRPTRRLDGV